MNRLVISALAALSLAGCDAIAESSTNIEKRGQEQLAQQAAITVGLPAIRNFTEKKQLKAIYELRDNANLVTYTYIYDMNGKRHKVCPTTSVGYGIPYATQYTNPQRVAVNEYQHGVATLPQADPNGLFSPPSADATWVICVDGKGNLSPAYIEQKIAVYLFEMPSIGE